MGLHICKHCGKPVHLTGDEIDKIQELYLQGIGITELSRQFKVTRNTIYRVVEPLRNPDEVGQGNLFIEDQPPGE